MKGDRHIWRDRVLVTMLLLLVVGSLGSLQVPTLSLLASLGEHVESRIGVKLRALDLDTPAVLRGTNAWDPAVAGQLARVSCKLASGQGITVLAIGGSNTDGRYKPFYSNVLQERLNEVFPVRDKNRSHKVIKFGVGGVTSEYYANSVSFEHIKVPTLTLSKCITFTLSLTHPGAHRRQ